MKRPLILFCTLLLYQIAGAQSISPEVHSTAGDHFSNANVQLSWTMGEPMIETFTGNNSILTQGFQQPDFIVTQIEEGNWAADYELSLYPNPTTSEVQLEIRREDALPLQVQLSDSRGKILQRQASLNPEETLRFDLSGYSMGNYVLSISQSNGQLVRSFHVQRIH